MSALMMLRRAALPVASAASASVRGISTRAMRQDFGWNKLVSPNTSPAFIARMQGIDAKFSGLRAESFGVAPTVEPIDWATWEKSITNKALVAQLKKEYESLKFDEGKAGDLTKQNASLDAQISKAKHAAQISRDEELPYLAKQLEKSKEEKSTVMGWYLLDYWARHPGADEQHRKEYMEGDFLVSDLEERMWEQDMAELRKQGRAGTLNPYEAHACTQLGNGADVGINFWARQQKVLDKMFGDAPAYQKMKADERAKRAKTMADVGEH